MTQYLIPRLGQTYVKHNFFIIKHDLTYVFPWIPFCILQAHYPGTKRAKQSYHNDKETPWIHWFKGFCVVTHRRLELRTPWLKVRCSTNWANGSYIALSVKLITESVTSGNESNFTINRGVCQSFWTFWFTQYFIFIRSWHIIICRCHNHYISW